ncbi:MraY family glycosyltransferase [uncultured Clostridium sp.]|uniref:MraY family glycosyltransferase n=1 Tax=uncultured Clostridium sp. TaxID=59620 RepID=UPI0025D18FA5|nr:MraY family glycosyltransferase [uncultured Clostridium sp.]
MQYLVPYISTFLIVYFLMPLIIKLAHKLEFTDKPTKRKAHKGAIPLCGGIGMYIGFCIIYFLTVQDTDNEKIWIFIAGTLIFLIGLVDDYYKTKGKEFPIYPRLIIQIFSAILIFNAGIAFKGFTNPFTGQYILLATSVQFILTITWIFGVTTVINWSDGMDGLAGGISLISAGTFFFVAIIMNQPSQAVFSIILAGALTGFLMFNKHPARVFMGDSGANFVGFLLSIIAIDGAFKQATVMSIFIPILALAVPIFDNIFVIIKRFREGKPIYQADRSQMHFRLSERGFTVNQVVSFILTISLVCSAASIFLLLIKK